MKMRLIFISDRPKNERKTAKYKNFSSFTFWAFIFYNHPHLFFFSLWFQVISECFKIK